MKRLGFFEMILKMAKLQTVRGFPARVLEVYDNKLSGRVGEPGVMSLRCDWDFEGKELDGKDWLDLKIDPAIKKILDPLVSNKEKL